MNASEALGMERFKSSFGSKYNKTPWFCQEIKELSTKRRQSYLKYKYLLTNDVYEEYKLMRKQVNQDIRTIKEDYWGRFKKKSGTRLLRDSKTNL
jgi:hypothetical protein